MSNSLLIACTAVVILVIIYFVKSRGLGIKSSKLHAKNPEAQALYAKKKNKEEKKLTMQEKLELSWKFLYEITDIILNKFSNDDRTKVNQIGKDLTKTGMKYNHVVDLGIRATASRAQTVEHEKEQSKTISR